MACLLLRMLVAASPLRYAALEFSLLSPMLTGLYTLMRMATLLLMVQVAVLTLAILLPMSLLRSALS